MTESKFPHSFYGSGEDSHSPIPEKGVPMIEEVVYAMLTEDTGKHFLDSGDAYGRHWQRNRRYTLEEFKARPMYEVEIYHRDGDLDDVYDWWLTTDLFQHMISSLELDDVCHVFNAIPVDSWDSDEFMGCSVEQEKFLQSHDIAPHPHYDSSNMPFNTYNYDGDTLSQCVQYYILQRGYPRPLSTDRVEYVLVQVHNGCDARGGYTNAKLFRVPKYHDVAYLFLDDEWDVGNLLEDFNDYVKFDGAERINEICGGALYHYEGYLYYRDDEVYAKSYKDKEQPQTQE